MVFLNPCAAIYNGLILSVHYITRFVLSKENLHKFETALHKPIIKLPDCIKCAVKINKDRGYCYSENSKNNISSQQNADIDGFAVFHFKLDDSRIYVW